MTICSETRTFFSSLSVEKPNIFKRIYDEIKYLVKMVAPGSKEAKQLERVKRTFDKAYHTNVSIDGNSTKNSLNENFKIEVDNWYNNEIEYNKKGGIFQVGKTSEALKSIGVKEQNIIWDKSKIKKILKGHPEMDIKTIKEVPNVIEEPIIVMQSKSRTNSITILGEVVANNGKPVMVAMQLQPEGKSGRIMDMIKISSAYGRNNAQDLIDTSDILYVEPQKIRTDNWLRALGLQLPVSLTKYGPINKVTYYDDVVNAELNDPPKMVHRST